EMAKLREERKRLARERKAEKEQSETPANNADDKKSAVAAAIARAKAKKAQQEENASEEPEDKKAAVAAAIARAKARKAQQETESQPVEETAS
ncbi:hypothetical protein OFN60_31805, partial [Escherichia coli]|nr:hypothetical protein [Escherichia coli]